ncbi:RNA ligase-domain-containing protein [Amylocarpus encephaloides]|uniref:tRNA ligase n=1 Tax=Amylocarpus encephaloides TaxID=45428 RepID=A0A9P7YE49_9HELO|nr:RNA ligase-domain-containing protein [Amylocarpus encephaloides]
MAATTPYAKQNVQEVQELIKNLEDSTKKDGREKKAGKTFSCKKTGFNVGGSPEDLVVHSWRFQDWDYKLDNLPTYARGLFTGKDEKGQSEISVRGYDKFFNTDEVNATKWRNIENNTKGPYELSLKENGCIIFLSGLHDGSLLVCSKHSTGARKDSLSHSKAAEKWVDKQLASIGKTRQDLATELRNRNATAVAELCDDDFEEHILAYGKDVAGLYLHGININLPEFMTYPGPQVQEFADAWGFLKTDFLVLDDIQTTKTFLDGVAETGHYNGRDIEGFVIRCKTKVDGKGPYVDWFFKYKFEEPYLMYRQWRECTKAIISGRPARFRKHIQITEEYLLYVRKRLAEQPGLGQAYQHNHGIIQLRDDFLREKNLKGFDIIRQEYALLGGAPEDVTQNVILVPIATLGCGKTTVALALVHLFGWGHVQNDNISGKGRPPRFTRGVLNLLEEHPVVFADRNNCQRHERAQILGDVHATQPLVRLVALHFKHTPEILANIREVTQTRVLKRGDNHQTIQATTDPNKVIGIMEGFLQRFEPLNPNSPPDDGFDSMIELDPTKRSRENLETVVSGLNATYPKLITEMPTSQDLDEAITFALSDYKPEIRHEISSKGGPKGKGPKNQPKQQPQIAKKPRPIEYISVNLSAGDIMNTLETSFASVSSNMGRFFKQLQESRRVQPEFHVTLIHRASSKEHPKLWKRYTDLHAAKDDPWGNKLGECQLQLERIVWDDRLMAIVARLVGDGWPCVNEVAHITIGTRSNDVKPKESNTLLKKWLVEGSGDATGIGEIALEGQVINGVVKAIQSR